MTSLPTPLFAVRQALEKCFYCGTKVEFVFISKFGPQVNRCPKCDLTVTLTTENPLFDKTSAYLLLKRPFVPGSCI
jgi:endogenous inhibitor of DNA gyrase (YacG/DUF329 family)